VSRIVVDASTAGAWILPDERSEEAEALLTRIAEAESKLVVPDLWIYEMTNLLLTALRRRRIDEASHEAAHHFLDVLQFECFDHEEPLTRERMARIAQRFDLSAYDASYLELADRLQCPLATFDERLSAAATTMGLAAATT
jgi:predicted nucleic acid-binding protein